jgi:hypothetical protein
MSRENLKPSTRVIYICSDTRSGSTLLDQMLGSHPEITSVGEICNINAYATLDRSQYDPAHELCCSCGGDLAGRASHKQCPFWSRLRERVGPLSNLQLNLRRSHPFLLAAVMRYPRLYPLLSSYGRKSFVIFDAIGGTVVDSSKGAFRFLALYAARPKAVKAIMLTRDYRAVVHSKMKRGRSLEQSARHWRDASRHMLTVERLVPASQRTRVRYEDLCTNTEEVMRDLCAFIGVGFDPAVLRRSPDTHHLGGSPSKFENRPIRLDDRYLTAFTDAEKELMARIVGRHASEWRYDG